MFSIFLALLMLVVAGPGLSDCWAIEQTDQTSISLSEYLHRSGLPLVEARVIAGPGGDEVLLLYGFVGTDSGTLDAESQALDFLDDPAVEVTNVIKVRPELQGLVSSRNGYWPVSRYAPAMSQPTAYNSTEELESPNADNDADSPDASVDREAEQPLDSLDSDDQ